MIWNKNEMENRMGIQEESETVKLMPKMKNRILRVIFSRFTLMFFLLLLEAGLLMSLYSWLAGYFRWFALAERIFTVLMVYYLFNCSMDASVKLTWLFLIMLFPVQAAILLSFTQSNLGHRMVKKRMEELAGETRDMLKQDPVTVQKPELIASGTDDLCRYLNRSGCFPIYENTQAKYFPLGEDMFEALLVELEKAEKFIFLEYFIIDEGWMWGRVLKILAEKAAAGVDVRVMYDGMCEISTLSGDYPERLAALGIRCKSFSRIYPFISSHYNYRDHRKILVIDGRTAFNGGVNMADEYINRTRRFGHWKDTAVMLKGAAVQSFTLMFLQMWNATEQNVSWEECSICEPVESDGYVMPYSDCPLDDEKAGESVYMDILYRAKHYVHIMTPYLILDNELETALRYAAERGVDVKIILPGTPDKKLPYAIAKSHYRSLIESGVKIYEYAPGFVHAKVFVSDDEKAVVGTINLDYRSLYHHYECATYLYQTSCIREIETDFAATLDRCREINPETAESQNRLYRLVGSLFKMFAPLM